MIDSEVVSSDLWPLGHSGEEWLTLLFSVEVWNNTCGVADWGGGE